MILIDLLRHGETETPGRLLGCTDPALSEEGWRQVERQTANRTWDLIVASPRRRASAAAERLAGAGSIAWRADTDWAELDFGDWDGRLIAELRADPSTAEAFNALYAGADTDGAPGGESWAGLKMRVAGAIHRLFTEATGGRVLVITHAGPMRAALALACGLPFANLWAFKIDPGTRITLAAGRDAGGSLWGEIVEVVQP
jgi:alpha-ribazole phosphatase